MLAAIVRASLGAPRIVTALACLIALVGLAALFSARFDVFPDFAPPHVLVQTEAPGLDAAQVEALVTRPLEGLLAGTENVKTVRSTSSQGLSAMQVVFDRSGDPYRQRQVVTERLPGTARPFPRGGRGAAAALAVELLDGVSRALRLHERHIVAARAARHRAVER